MTRMDRSSGSIEGHFPVPANAEQPRQILPKEQKALIAKLKKLIKQAHKLNERSCAMHLKFALAALKPHQSFDD